MDYVPPKVRYFTGLDVGQTGEFTSLAVLERTREWNADGGAVCTYAVRHLKRFPVGTPYPEISACVTETFTEAKLRSSSLVVDITTVGWPFIRQLRSMDAGIEAVTVTNGHAATYDAGGWLVPTKELVTTLQLLLQTRRLSVASTLSDAPTLVQELATFSMRKASLSNAEKVDWRERPHDDLVLAVAVAAWMGERLVEPFVEGPLFLSPMPESPDGVSGLIQSIVAEMEWDD